MAPRIVKRDVKVAGVDQLGKNGVNGGEEIIEVARAAGFFGHTIQRCLQLFGTLAFGDVEGGGQHGVLPAKRNGAGAEVEPACLAFFGEHAIFVAVGSFGAAHARLKVRLHQGAVIGMHQRERIHAEKFFPLVSGDGFAGAIAKEKFIGLMDVDG